MSKRNKQASGQERASIGARPSFPQPPVAPPSQVLTDFSTIEHLPVTYQDLNNLTDVTQSGQSSAKRSGCNACKD